MTTQSRNISSLPSPLHLSFSRWLCSSSPRQPFPSEPASAPHPQPDADQSHACWLWHHARADVCLLPACSANHHGSTGRDGPHGPHDARNGCRRRRGRGGERGDERGDPGLHVHATAPDEHATPGWVAARWNHQPVPFVRGRGEDLTQSYPSFLSFFALFHFGSLRSFKMNKEMSYPIYPFITNSKPGLSPSPASSYLNTLLLLLPPRSFSLSATSCLVLCVPYWSDDDDRKEFASFYRLTE